MDESLIWFYLVLLLARRPAHSLPRLRGRGDRVARTVGSGVVGALADPAMGLWARERVQRQDGAQKATLLHLLPLLSTTSEESGEVLWWSISLLILNEWLKSSLTHLSFGRFIIVWSCDRYFLSLFNWISIRYVNLHIAVCSFEFGFTRKKMS